MMHKSGEMFGTDSIRFTPSQQKKRLKYYEERRTTSHWPYPLHVNGLQPQTYGNADLLIDYTKIIKPNLADLDEKIRLLL